MELVGFGYYTGGHANYETSLIRDLGRNSGWDITGMGYSSMILDGTEM